MEIVNNEASSRLQINTCVWKTIDEPLGSIRFFHWMVIASVALQDKYMNVL